jgi:homogentisate phytyltransferase / homogentisate geranylgeranyltransferase
MNQAPFLPANHPQPHSLKWLRSLWKFSRPHTIIGTSLSVLTLYLIALGNISEFFSHWLVLLITWVACLAGNVYIVGLNQLEDIDIDKINKPHLPLAGGEFSLLTGRLIVGFTGLLAIILAFVGGFWLLMTVGISLLIGTAYSLPPVRLKRFPFWAAFCIFTVRGVIVNLGLFSHYNTVINQNQSIYPSVWVLTAFILVFTVAIAIFKDVPDLEGDRIYQITTFTLLLGKEKILTISLLTISLCYAGMIIVGLLGIAGINSLVVIVGHLLLLVLLWWRSRGVNLENKSEISQFYQFIWKLFFLEYLLFPLACLL